jgi:hypothetical protein
MDKAEICLERKVIKALIESTAKAGETLGPRREHDDFSGLSRPFLPPGLQRAQDVFGCGPNIWRQVVFEANMSHNLHKSVGDTRCSYFDSDIANIGAQLGTRHETASPSYLVGLVSFR